MSRLNLRGKWAYPLALTLLQACTCDQIVSEQIRSPDDRHQVVVFSELCTYNTNLNTKVAVTSSDQASRWTENAFWATHGRSEGPYNDGGGPVVHARWAGNDTVVLTYNNSAVVRVRNQEIGGIVIRYEVDSVSVTGSATGD